MADSDHTTTLPSVTRSEYDGSNFMASSSISRVVAGASSDPAVAVALAWTEAHAFREAHCTHQQELETRLMLGANLAGVTYKISTGRRKDHISMSEAYRVAKAEETLAAAREQALLGRLSTTQATSLSGIAAKLSVVVRESEDNTDLRDFPIDQVRSALNDLQRIMDRGGATSAGSQPAISDGGKNAAGSSTVAAWYAFEARMRGDEDHYRIWTSTYEALTRLSSD